MHGLKKNFVYNTYSLIRKNMPPYVLHAMHKILPLYFFSSLFEIFSLIILVPVINIILNPELIEEKEYLRFPYDFFAFDDHSRYVVFLLFITVIIFLIKNILLYLIFRYQKNISFSLAQRLAIDKYRIYMNKPYSFYTENNTAVLLRNTTGIPFEFVSNVFLPLITILNEVCILIMIVLGIVLYDFTLFVAVILFILPFLFFYYKTYKKKLNDTSVQKDKGSEGIYTITMQSFENFREITVFDKLLYFEPRFRSILKSYSDALSDLYLLNLFSPRIVETAAAVCILSVFLAGYIFGKELNALAQFLIIFSIAAYRIIPSINKLILSANFIKSGFFVLNYFNKQEDDNISLKSISSIQAENISFKNDLEIRSLSFTYPGSLENILKNLNLLIQKRETIGIVGVSGSGKTTLLNILLRLYKETEGGIYLDGCKITDSMLYQWYRLISYVPQNIKLLDGTLLENIAFGINNENINREALMHAVKKSQLDSLISQLPDGLNTRVGEDGIKISGGQKQRIGIARALYHGGSILIFDEATSALDRETENLLTEDIRSLSHQDYAIVIVAHRLSTLKYCDHIYELKNGELSPPLSYDELRKRYENG